MQQWMGRNFLYLAGAAIGAVAGYLYWKYVGCVSGTCAITGNAFNSTVYFAVMGAVLSGLFMKEKK